MNSIAVLSRIFTGKKAPPSGLGSDYPRDTAGPDSLNHLVNHVRTALLQVNSAIGEEGIAADAEHIAPFRQFRQFELHSECWHAGLHGDIAFGVEQAPGVEILVQIDFVSPIRNSMDFAPKFC